MKIEFEVGDSFLGKEPKNDQLVAVLLDRKYPPLEYRMELTKVDKDGWIEYKSYVWSPSGKITNMSKQRGTHASNLVTALLSGELVYRPC